MVNTTNEYGFVPSSPTQARDSNTGIFEVNDISELLLANQWSVMGNLELIQTITPAAHDGEADFDSIDASTYDTHLLTVSNMGNVSGQSEMWIRFKEGGVLNSGTNYAYNYELLNQSNNTNYGSNATTYIRTVIRNEQGSNGYGVVWLYGLGNSSSYSVVTFISGLGAQGHGGTGGGTFYSKSAVDGIRVTAGNNYNYNAETVLSLYGVKA
jgi:hypothetical protein